MNRRTFLGLLGLIGCKDELMDIKKTWWLNTGAGVEAAPDAPDYSLLTNKEVYDFTGLVVGAANDYGTVNSDAEITQIKSLISPAAVFNNVNLRGTRNTILIGNKASYVAHGSGQGLFRYAGAIGDWNFLSYHASGYASLKWTVHTVVRLGFSNDHGYGIGILGSNAGGDPTKRGILLYQGDRPFSPQDDTFGLQLTKSTAGLINNSTTDSVLPSNQWVVVTVEFDGSLGATNSVKLFVDGVQKTVNNTSTSTTVVSGPAYLLEIMGMGNGAVYAPWQISHMVLQTKVESESVRNAFISELQSWADYWNTDVNEYGQITKLINEGRYYLHANIIQDQVNPDKMVAIFQNGTLAAAEDGKKISIMKSTDRGATWGVFADLLNPASTEFALTACVGVTAANKYICIIDTHTNVAGVTSAPHKLYYLYSTNDGDSWTTVDITSVIPSDGLATFRCESQVIENNGRIMFSIYKLTAEGVTTNSANYLIYSDDDGATWAAITIRASAAAYINESSLVHLTGDNILQVSANYATNDWTVFTSDDNGDTWTQDGDITLGIAAVIPTPSKMHKFVLNGYDIIALYHYQTSSKQYKCAYARVVDLLSDPLNASWKYTITWSNAFLMHGDYCHINGGLQAAYVSPMQPETFTGLTDFLIYGYTPTYHEQALKSALGI